MNKVIISGREIELCFNNKAMFDIAKRCNGDINNISDMIKGGTDAQGLELICGILADLANGAVVKHNCEIAMGIGNGEKRNPIPEDTFVALVQPTELNDMLLIAFEEMGMGSTFEMPENVKVEEKDIDLAELEAEKNKSKKS